MKILIEHCIIAVFDLDLYCLPMSHKKDARLKWVKDAWAAASQWD